MKPVLSIHFYMDSQWPVYDAYHASDRSVLLCFIS